MAERTIALRIAIRDAEQAARTLRSLGTEGEAALSKLATGTAPVNRALGGLSGLFDDVGARATASWGPFDGVAGRLVGLGPAGIAAVAGIGAVTAAIAVGVRETAQAEVSYARLEGVLRATGGASGLTAKQIGELADEMESTTLATAEGVQDAAAALATFRSVSGDTFTDALRLAQDMASVFGGDLRGAAVQLGKALEDPIQGINALRRSGVSFSDAQKDVIKDLVETGRVAEAQRLILDALADQVGGAGEAEGHTLTGSFHAATAALGNMLEAMAKASKSADILKTTLLGFKIAFDAVGSAIGGASAQDTLGANAEEIKQLQVKLESEKSSPIVSLPAVRQIEERIAALTRENEAIVKNLDSERKREDRAQQQGALQQETIKRENLLGSIKEMNADLEKAAARHETEAQGIGRVNRELDEQLKKITAMKEAARKSGASAAELAPFDEAAAKARANARAEIADLQKSRAESQKTTSDKRGEFVAVIETEIATSDRLAEALTRGTAAYDAERAAIEAENRVRQGRENLSAQEQASLTQRLAGSKARRDALDREVQALRQLEQAEAKLAAPAGLTESGKALSIADLVGLSTEDVDEVQKRAAYVQAILKTLGDQAPEVKAGIAARATSDFNEQLANDRIVAFAKLENAIGREREETERLTAVQGQSANARRRVEIEIAAENRLRQAGLQIGTAEFAQKKAELVALGLQADALERVNNLRNEMDRLQADAFLGPLEEWAGKADNLFSNVFGQMRETGKLDFMQMLESFNDSAVEFGASIADNLISLPIKEAMAKFRTDFAEAQAGGQDGFGAFQTAMGKQGPLAQGMMGYGIGATVGTGVTAATGGNQQGAAIGSAAGALIGGVVGSAIPVIGTFLGAAVGGALGGIVGGLFGGGEGENNDAMGFRYNPTTGAIEQTDKGGSSQNRNSARRITDEAVGISSFLQQQGLTYQSREPLTFKVGNKSGVTFEDEEFDTAGLALNAAIKMLVENSAGEISEATKTVLDNTKAQSLSELKSDVDFARNYERLTSKIGDFGIELLELRDSFGEASTRAKELGLDTQALADAQAEAEAKLVEERQDSLENQLKGQAQQLRDYFENLSAPYRQALGAFGIANDNAAPQAILRGGLGEFRETLAAAMANDNSAIANLPGLGQQVIAAARAYGGSGAEAQNVIAEITRGLREVLGANEARRDEVLASIPDTLRITSADQVRTMQEEMAKTREKLEEMRRDLARLRPAS